MPASRARHDPSAQTPQSPQPRPAPLRLNPTPPGEAAQVPLLHPQPGRGPAPLPASPALRSGSAPPRRLRAPLRGTHRTPGQDSPGRSHSGRDAHRRLLLLSTNPGGEQRVAVRVLPRLKAISPPPQLSPQVPSLVRAARRKCHQRPFRSAPHFRPEPQSPRRLARAAAVAGASRNWRGRLMEARQCHLAEGHRAPPAPERPVRGHQVASWASFLRSLYQMK